MRQSAILVENGGKIVPRKEAGVGTRLQLAEVEGITGRRRVGVEREAILLDHGGH